MDTANLCRSCMKEVASWEMENFNSRAVDMFCFCTNISITEDDKLPKQFCYDCIIKIESSYTYIIEARKVDMTLKSIVSRYNTSVIVELDAQTVSNHHTDHLKLTLPDYKICTTTENIVSQEEILSDNVDMLTNENTKLTECSNDTECDNVTVEEAGQSDIPESVKESDDAGDLKKNVCPVCRKGFLSKAWFSKHMEKEHSGKKFVCSHCPKKDDKLPKQFCYDCIIKIESSYTYIIEARKVDMTLKSIVSRYNTSVIVELDAQTVSNHHTDHLKLTLPDYKICTTTENIVSQEEILSDNVDMLTNENTKLTECSNDTECDNVTVEEAGQSDIPESVKESDDAGDLKKNVCPVCRKGFLSKAWFSKHMEKEHSGKKFVCSHCPKTFSKASQLSYHSASHSDERKFACTACGKRFKRRKQLTTHARAHADARPFACDKCTMRFKLKSVLKCHMKVHEGDKQYLCYFCGWSFAQAGNLKVHMRKHTGEKPFRCSECAFLTAAASSLRRHQRRHRAVRPHVCPHCRKGFYDASGLSRHVRTHTGELPYRCPGCARSFADSWKRKTHLMRAHHVPLQDIPRMRRDPRDPDQHIPLLMHA